MLDFNSGMLFLHDQTSALSEKKISQIWMPWLSLYNEIIQCSLSLDDL